MTKEKKEKIAKPLSANQWRQVKEIVELLEPIKDVSQSMCAEKIPTLSYMMPHFDDVLDVLQDHEKEYRKRSWATLDNERTMVNEDAESIADGLKAAINKILKYFEVASDYAILATVLDPRAKLDYYKANLDSAYPEIVREQVSSLAEVLNLEAAVEMVPFL